MRSRLTLLLLFGIFIFGGFAAQTTPAFAGGIDAFVEVATAANTTGNAVLVDNPLAQGDINTALLVTPNYNPGGVGGVYNNHPIAIRVSATTVGSDIRWEIFNRDNAPMPVGASFNVAVYRAPESIQRATTGLIGPNYILFDHSLLNGQPNALAIITMLNIATAAPVVTSPIGVWYEGSSQHWGGFFEDASTFQTGWGFNVGVFDSTLGFLHTTSAANINSNWSYLDNPLVNNNPNAIIVVSHSYNPGGVGGTYHNHEVGVWYDTSVGRWAIFNQDLTAMAAGVAFNVAVVGQSSGALPPMGSGATAVPSGPVSCLPTRLTAGGYAQVTPGGSVRLRTGPGLVNPVITEIGVGQIASVIGNQTCDTSAGILWVNVSFGGNTGWIAESLNPNYLVQPSGPPAPATLPPPPPPSGSGPVTSVSVSVSPGSSSTCPSDVFTFTASITTNGPATVQYRWGRSDGASAPVQTISFASAGTQNVTDTWTIGAGGSFYEYVDILSPNVLTSNQAYFNRSDCSTPQVTSVSASVSPSSSSTCPSDVFTFTAAITTNGPMTVQYRWGRSDGASAPVQTISFASAGTQNVTTTWTIGAGGSFYEYVDILSPNTLTSNHANFSRTACP
jgi:SH3 domain-containing protein